MTKYKNLIGKKFGRLTVIGLSERKSRKTYWVCQCDCGNITEARSDGLQSGRWQSCGCLKRETSAENVSKNHTHKQSGTRLYKILQGMKTRCYNVNDRRYADYGGRGITICDEWIEDFNAFYEWSMTHGYTDDFTIDRIDNDKGYSPDNCRWTTNKEQSNNRSTNVLYKIGNATKTIMQWCEIFELDYKVVIARFHRGTSSIDELFAPVRSQYRGKQSDSE